MLASLVKSLAMGGVGACRVALRRSSRALTPHGPQGGIRALQSAWLARARRRRATTAAATRGMMRRGSRRGLARSTLGGG